MIKKQELLEKLEKMAIPMEVDVTTAAEDLGCDQERLLSYMIKYMAQTAGACRNAFKDLIETCDKGEEKRCVNVTIQ